MYNLVTYHCTRPFEELLAEKPVLADKNQAEKKGNTTLGFICYFG